MPRQHNPQRGGASAQTPSRVKLRNKSNPSACKSSYMLPTESERRRQLSSLSRPSLATPLKRQSIVKSKPPMSKKSPPARTLSKKHGNTCPSSSTLLFPRKHSANLSRPINKKCSYRYPNVVNDSPVEMNHAETFDGIIDVDPDSVDELKTSGGELGSPPQPATVDLLDALEDVSSASLLSGKYRGGGQDVATPESSVDVMDVTRRKISIELESKASSSSTVQLVRQCTQCKMLYQTSHTCCVKGNTPSTMLRPRTAPAARSVRSHCSPGVERDNASRSGRQIDAHRDKGLLPRPTSSSSVRRNLPVGVFSSNRKLLRHRPNSATSSTSASASPDFLRRSIADSFAYSGESAVRAAENKTKYDYASISKGSRRPKSASSLWRHRPLSSLRVLEY